jgi:tRNA threonylcarbamoyl adenosine modification protein YeaZ
LNRHRLVIDTSVGTSVAVLLGGEVVAEVTNADPMRHAERIGAALQEVLAAAKIGPHEIGSVVAGRGPAPFTGLRIGLAAATGFATSLGVPLYGVVSLDAIAAAERAVGAALGEELLVTTDARRGEVYWALYAAGEGAPRPLRGPLVNKLDDVLTDLENAGLAYTRATATVSAGWVGRVFEQQLAAGLESRDVTPLYLRAPDAQPPANLAGKPVSG